MSISRVFFSDLKSGKCSSVVEARLLRFSEARNVKRGGELMWVDMLLMDVNVSLILLDLLRSVYVIFWLLNLICFSRLWSKLLSTRIGFQGSEIGSPPGRCTLSLALTWLAVLRTSSLRTLLWWSGLTIPPSLTCYLIRSRQYMQRDSGSVTKQSWLV